MQTLLNKNNQYTDYSFKARVGNPRKLPKSISSSILSGEIPSFFVSTPPKVTKLMIEKVGGITDKETVLEPSAGYGHIIDSILENTTAKKRNIYAVEPIDTFREHLKKKGVNLVGQNILDYNPGPIFDKVIMNPPFYEGQDILHVLHCYKLLKPGGKLVSVLPDNALTVSKTPNPKWQKDWLGDGRIMSINEHLQELLHQPGVTHEKVSLGNAFLDSDVPDDVKTSLLIIRKPKDNIF